MCKGIFILSCIGRWCKWIHITHGVKMNNRELAAVEVNLKANVTLITKIKPITLTVKWSRDSILLWSCYSKVRSWHLAKKKEWIILEYLSAGNWSYTQGRFNSGLKGEFPTMALTKPWSQSNCASLVLFENQQCTRVTD